MAFYCEQLLGLAPRLEKADLGISHWVGDGYCPKQKVFEAIEQVGADLTRAALFGRESAYLQATATFQSGEPKKKIDWTDSEELRRRFEIVGRLPDKPEIRVPWAVAYSPHFDRDLRIVLLANADFSDS